MNCIFKSFLDPSKSSPSLPTRFSPSMAYGACLQSRGLPLHGHLPARFVGDIDISGPLSVSEKISQHHMERAEKFLQQIFFKKPTASHPLNPHGAHLPRRRQRCPCSGHPYLDGSFPRAKARPDPPPQRPIAKSHGIPRHCNYLLTQIFKLTTIT